MPRLTLLLVIALLAGCGQKGPLYLPAPPGPAVPAPAPDAAGPAAAAADPAGNAAPESEDRERAVPAAQP